MLALAGGAGIQPRWWLGDAPPISLFSVMPEKRETGRARSKEKREALGHEFDRKGQIVPKVRGLA
nr:hypothetical protein [uncultured Oscillibacter sp.]